MGDWPIQTREELLGKRGESMYGHGDAPEFVASHFLRSPFKSVNDIRKVVRKGMLVITSDEHQCLLLSLAEEVNVQ
jgi:hypothetical protein